jgi:hypothetical protein
MSGAHGRAGIFAPDALEGWRSSGRTPATVKGVVPSPGRTPASDPPARTRRGAPPRRRATLQPSCPPAAVPRSTWGSPPTRPTPALPRQQHRSRVLLGAEEYVLQISAASVVARAGFRINPGDSLWSSGTAYPHQSMRGLTCRQSEKRHGPGPLQEPSP